jgi:ribulose kinase
VSQSAEGEKLGGEGEWNVILWADHRAEEEAEEINKTGEGVLGFVGGTMSVSEGRRVRMTRVANMILTAS